MLRRRADVCNEQWYETYCMPAGSLELFYILLQISLRLNSLGTLLCLSVSSIFDRLIETRTIVINYNPIPFLECIDS